MSTQLEYQQKIQIFNWKELTDLWKQIEARDTTDWELGKAFEYLVVRMFELDGAIVKYPYTVTQRTTEGGHQVMEQVDGIVYVESLSCIIESKDYQDGDKTNIEPIYKLRNQLLRRPSGVIGSVFSRTGFTDAAITLASFMMPQAILLWEGGEIEVVLKEKRICSFLVTKLRRCIETGSPNYNITTDTL